MSKRALTRRQAIVTKHGRCPWRSTVCARDKLLPIQCHSMTLGNI